MKGIGNGGGGRGLFIHNLYVCYVKVGKLGFCERGFSNLLALKIYIFTRGDLIKTKSWTRDINVFSY